MKSLNKHIKEQFPHIELSKDVNEGISYDDGTFTFNFVHDGQTDVIHLVKQKLKYARLPNIYDVQTFAFEPNEKQSNSNLSDFYRHIKNSDFNEKSDERAFIMSAIGMLNDEIDLRKFKTIVYPQSRTTINKLLVTTISRIYKVDYATFEMVKVMPENVKFDFKKFENEILNDEDENGIKRYSKRDKKTTLAQVKNDVEKTLSKHYFSIAEASKSKYKRFFTDFLQFKNDDERDNFKSLDNGEILIIDDFATTGTTIYEIIKIIRNLGIDSKITVFTLVGHNKL